MFLLDVLVWSLSILSQSVMKRDMQGIYVSSSVTLKNQRLEFLDKNDLEKHFAPNFVRTNPLY